MKYYVYYSCFDSHELREFSNMEEVDNYIKEETKDKHYKTYANFRIIKGVEIDE